jgi:hypothetical protein
VIRTPLHARRGAAALIVAACAAAISVPAALGQASPQVTVNPNSGAAGSSVMLTLTGFDVLNNCHPEPGRATRETCIYVDFKQGARVTTVAVASGSGSTTIKVPTACTPQAAANCSDPGAATLQATSPNGQTNSTTFTVTGTAATSTTSTTPGSTTTTSTTSTTVATTTTVSTVVLAPTTSTSVPVKTKKSSSHSDVPRYIAVVLVVLAAAATAGVDTRLRRLRS